MTQGGNTDQQREHVRRARLSASVPTRPTVQHVGQPRHATAVSGSRASETGPTTATRTHASTAAARPAAPLNRCSRTELLASAERCLLATSCVLVISPSLRRDEVDGSPAHNLAAATARDDTQSDPHHGRARSDCGQFALPARQPTTDPCDRAHWPGCDSAPIERSAGRCPIRDCQTPAAAVEIEGDMLWLTGDHGRIARSSSSWLTSDVLLEDEVVPSAVQSFIRSRRRSPKQQPSLGPRCLGRTIAPSRTGRNLGWRRQRVRRMGRRRHVNLRAQPGEERHLPGRARSRDRHHARHASERRVLRRVPLAARREPSQRPGLQNRPAGAQLHRVGRRARPAVCRVGRGGEDPVAAAQRTTAAARLSVRRGGHPVEPCGQHH